MERIADKFVLINKGRVASVKSREDLMSENKSVRIVVYGDSFPTGFIELGGGRAYINVLQQDQWRVLDEIKLLNLQLVSVLPQLTLESLYIEVAGN